MTIVYKLDAEGGFICGDTETGRTAYAYPSSAQARLAKADPAPVARGMMRGENRIDAIWRTTGSCAADDLRRMTELRRSAWGATAA
jgi:hypothetical protein